MNGITERQRQRHGMIGSQHQPPRITPSRTVPSGRITNIRDVVDSVSPNPADRRHWEAATRRLNPDAFDGEGNITPNAPEQIRVPTEEQMRIERNAQEPAPMQTPERPAPEPPEADAPEPLPGSTAEEERIRADQDPPLPPPLLQVTPQGPVIDGETVMQPTPVFRTATGELREMQEQRENTQSPVDRERNQTPDMPIMDRGPRLPTQEEEAVTRSVDDSLRRAAQGDDAPTGQQIEENEAERWERFQTEELQQHMGPLRIN